MSAVGGSAARTRAVRWVLLVLFGLFFAVPLLSMADFSTRAIGGAGRTLQAWRNLLEDDQLFSAITISLLLAAVTVVMMLVVLVPTMIWVRLRARWAGGLVEFLCLLPLTIPALVIAVGLKGVYAWVYYFLGGSTLTLAFVYVVLVLPYAYRAIDGALSSIPLDTLVEASRSLGAGWTTSIVRVVVPNIWSGIVSAAFVSITVVLGEYTIASLSGFSNLQVVVVQVGKTDGPTAVAASLAVLVLGFVLLAALSLLTAGRRGRRTPSGGGGAAAVASPAPTTTGTTPDASSATAPGAAS